MFTGLENVREYGGKSGLDVTTKGYQPGGTSYWSIREPHHLHSRVKNVLGASNEKMRMNKDLIIHY